MKFVGIYIIIILFEFAYADVDYTFFKGYNYDLKIKWDQVLNELFKTTETEKDSFQKDFQKNVDNFFLTSNEYTVFKEPSDKIISEQLKPLNDLIADKIPETSCFLQTLWLRFQNFLNDKKPKFYSDKESVQSILVELRNRLMNGSISSKPVSEINYDKIFNAIRWHEFPLFIRKSLIRTHYIFESTVFSPISRIEGKPKYNEKDTIEFNNGLKKFNEYMNKWDILNILPCFYHKQAVDFVSQPSPKTHKPLYDILAKINEQTAVRKENFKGITNAILNADCEKTITLYNRMKYSLIDLLAELRFSPDIDDKTSIDRMKFVDDDAKIQIEEIYEISKLEQVADMLEEFRRDYHSNQTEETEKLLHDTQMAFFSSFPIERMRFRDICYDFLHNSHGMHNTKYTYFGFLKLINLKYILLFFIGITSHTGNKVECENHRIQKLKDNYFYYTKNGNHICKGIHKEISS